MLFFIFKMLIQEEVSSKNNNRINTCNPLAIADINAVVDKVTSSKRYKTDALGIKNLKAPLLSRELGILENLPYELIDYTLTLLNIKNLLNFALTCKKAFTFVFQLKKKGSYKNISINKKIFDAIFNLPFQKFIQCGELNKAFFFLKKNVNLFKDYEELNRQYLFIANKLVIDEDYVSNFVSSLADLMLLDKEYYTYALKCAVANDLQNKFNFNQLEVIFYSSFEVCMNEAKSNADHFFRAVFFNHLVFKAFELSMPQKLEWFHLSLLAKIKWIFLDDTKKKTAEIMLAANPFAFINVCKKLILCCEQLNENNEKYGKCLLDKIKVNVVLSITGLLIFYINLLDKIKENSIDKKFYLSLSSEIKTLTFYNKKYMQKITSRLKETYCLNNLESFGTINLKSLSAVESKLNEIIYNSKKL